MLAVAIDATIDEAAARKSIVHCVSLQCNVPHIHILSMASATAFSFGFCAVHSTAPAPSPPAAAGVTCAHTAHCGVEDPVFVELKCLTL
jgi:hypothetical protein